MQILVGLCVCVKRCFVCPLFLDVLACTFVVRVSQFCVCVQRRPPGHEIRTHVFLLNQLDGIGAHFLARYEGLVCGVCVNR